MELLRIVSMIMVLVVHIDGASLGLPEPYGHFNTLDSRSIWQLTVEAFAIIGVNCFTIISGYFGIRLRLRSCLSFIFQCLFYSVGIYTAISIAIPSFFSWEGWIESWLILSHNDLWYVPAYFGLMIISPVLNAGLESLTKKQYALVLTLFAFFNIWLGWVWNAQFNPTGYTIVQLIFVYMIGRYIRLYGCKKANAGRTLFTHRPIWIYIGGNILVLGTSIWMPSVKAFAYNSPAVLLSTIGLFLVFRNMEFTSRAVNIIAKSAFAVYLIHKNPLIWGNIIRPSVRYMWEHLSLPAFSVAAILLIIAIFMAAIIADGIRRQIYEICVNRFLRNTANSPK